MLWIHFCETVCNCLHVEIFCASADAVVLYDNLYSHKKLYSTETDKDKYIAEFV